MDQVQEVREKIDIVAFISEYVPLKQTGANFKGRCPFHGEKTPSFVVSQERQIWHCFGCSKGGDIYTFLMEYEHIEFVEALRILAKRAGVTLRKLSKKEQGIVSKKDRILEANHLSLEFYHYLLVKHKAAEKTREYLTRRQISQKLVETFQLGYAPASGIALVDFLKKKQFTSDEIIEAGLGSFRSGRLFDFFRDRLVFPLIDVYENVLGFSGRALTDAQQPKYMNTKETLVYHKGAHLFGIQVTKNEIRQKNQVLLVEGEFDVLSLFQAGMGNTVAVKGTALTEDQLKLLGRYAKKVIFCLDTDVAGKKALLRSLPIVEKVGLTPAVVVLPGGKDPDEAIKENEVAVKQAVKQAEDVYDMLLTRMTKRYKPDTVEGKRRLTSLLLPLFAAIQNEIVKEHYLKKLSDILGVSIESIVREMDKGNKLPAPVAPLMQGTARTRQETLEEYLLALLIQYPAYVQAVDKELITLFTTYSYTQPAKERLFQLLLTETTKEQIPEELRATYNACALLPLPEFTDAKKVQEEAIQTAHTLLSLSLKKQLKEISQVIGQEQDTKKLEELQEKFTRLTSLLKAAA